SGLNLGLADIGGEVDHLALKIGEVNVVGIGDADGANPGRCQIKRDGRSQTAGADDQDLAVEESTLSFSTYLFKDDMPRIALDLFFGQHQWPPPMKYRNSTMSPSFTRVLSKVGRSRISPFSSTVT